MGRAFVTKLTKNVAIAHVGRLPVCGADAQTTGMVSLLEKIPQPKGMLERNFSVACVGGFALLALGSYGFAAYDLLRALVQPYLDYTVVDRDFANYWVAGRLLQSGEYLDLFDHYRYFPHLQELFGANYQIRSWSYPPHYLLFVWPLGFMDYKAGLVVFLSSTLLLFALAVAVFRRQFAPQSDLSILFLALLGYVLMMFVAAQNGFLTAALLLLGLAFMRRRPALAGLVFACLTIKPQLGAIDPGAARVRPKLARSALVRHCSRRCSSRCPQFCLVSRAGARTLRKR